MLLSFSIPAMLPMIEAGLRQRAGEDVGAARVKRQTYRRIGPRAEKLLAWDTMCHFQPYDLHLWWKSRTKAKRNIGTVDGGSKIYAIDIMHTWMQSPGCPRETIFRIDGPRGWRSGDAMLFWKPGDPADSGFEQEARADGFDNAQAFVDFFVPNMGETFRAALFKW